MVKTLTFDVRYDNRLAHDYYGDGEELVKWLSHRIFDGKGLDFPNEFDSTSTLPPIHFIPVSAPDEIDIEALRAVHIPEGLKVEIMDLED